MLSSWPKKSRRFQRTTLEKVQQLIVFAFHLIAEFAQNKSATMKIRCQQSFRCVLHLSGKRFVMRHFQFFYYFGTTVYTGV